MNLRWASICAAVLLSACVDDGGSEGGGDAAAVDMRGLSDAERLDSGEPDAGEVDPDDGIAPDASGLDPDDGVTPDVAVVPPDAFLGTTIEDCEDACDRYEECGRLDTFGDRAACERYCERVTRDGTPDNWWSCLEVEACNLMNRCPRPEPEPLTCAELCEQAEGCEVGLPFEDCEGRCEEGGDPFVACGERLVAGCDNDGFLGCLQSDVYPQCEAFCGRAVGCNVLAEGTCAADCIADLFAADPLARLRSTQRNQCVQRAAEDDCLAVDECVFPPDPENPGAAPDLATFCAAYNPCDFFFYTCDEAYEEFAFEGAGALRCALDTLRRGCPFDEFDLFDACVDGVDPNQAACGSYCEARDVCELLDEGEGRADCSLGCTEVLTRAEDEAERLAALLACGRADTCDDLSACLERSDPRRECEAHCQLLDGCGLAAEDCVDACDAVWVRDRQAAYRDCVRLAREDCDAVAACGPPRDVSCEEACTAVSECGAFPAESIPACSGACDDDHQPDPVVNGRLVACVVAAPVCGNQNEVDVLSVERCRFDPENGDECWAFCRALTDYCDADSEMDYVECLQGCGDGLGGDLGLRYAAAEPCLAALDNGDEAPDCAAAQACIPGDVELDCAGYCEAADGCGIERASCEARCADDALSQLRVLEASRCLGDAGDDCDAVVACVDPPAPPLEGEANPLADACARLCRAEGFCNPDLDQGACRTACRAAWNPADPDSVPIVAPRLACAGAWSCEDLTDCLEGSTPEAICERHCAAVDGCGGAPDGCVEDCAAGFARDRQIAWRACVKDAGDDCAAVDACTPPPALPCDRYCDKLSDCGVAEARCEQDCDDDHFAAPLDSAIAVSCVLAAQSCNDEEGLTVVQCLEDPAAGAGACVGFCRATTECAGNDDEAALIACVDRCTRGFPDREGLLFAQSAACLGGVQVDAACDALLACVPEAPESDCATYCQTVGDCGAPADGCADACAAEPDLDREGCVADALRVGTRCGGVAACIGFEPEPADAACEAWCDHRYECDRAVDPFLCERECTPTPEALPVQLGCALVSTCEELAECMELGADLDASCAEPCAAVAGCGLYADDAACEAACTGQASSPGAAEDYTERLAACVEETVEDPCNGVAVAECFNPSLCELTRDVVRVPSNGGRFMVDTRQRENLYQGSCGGGGPEQILSITIRQRSLLHFETINNQYDTLIWMRSACDEANAELDCDDDGGDGGEDGNGLASLIEEVVEPGTYFMFVDGFGAGSGETEVLVTVQPQ